ncbi:MAG: hypothetical protein ACK4OP_18465, partial [Gemmobacter sp.]
MSQRLSRRLLLAFVAAAAARPMPVRAQDGLSLGQRRGIATYEAEILPGLIARLTEAAGKPIP